MRRSISRPSIAAFLGLSLSFWALYGTACTTAPQPDVGEHDPVASREPEDVADPDDLFEELRRYVRAGETDAALELYESRHSEFPQNSRVDLLAAHLYMAAGRIGEAADFARSAADVGGGAEAWRILAMVARERGDAEEEREALEQAQRNDSKSPDILAALGRWERIHGDPEEARGFLSQALEADPSYVPALHQLAHLMVEQDREEEAADYFDSAVEQQPNDPYLLSDRAHFHMRSGYYGAAEEDFARAIDLDPDFAWHYIDRGRARQEQGYQEAAIEDFTRALELKATLFLPYVYRGASFMAAEQPEAAVEDFEQALALRPDYEPVYPQFATSLYMNERYVEAADFFERSYQENPGEYGYALMAAAAGAKGGGVESARRRVTRVRGSIPSEDPLGEVSEWIARDVDEGRMVRTVEQEPKGALRARAAFHAGVWTLMNNRRNTARALFRLAAEEGKPGMVETELSTWYLTDGPLRSEE